MNTQFVVRTGETVTQSVAEKFRIMDSKGGWLATIFLDNDTGMISIQSQYGSYSHGWSKSGRGTDKLTGFLMHCDDGYLMHKFSYEMEDWLNYDATLEQIKQDIIEVRKSGEIAKKEAREYWNELDSMEDTSNPRDYSWMFLERCPQIFHAIYADDYSAIPCVTDVQPRLRMFMQKVWPLFIQAIKADPELSDGEPRYGN